MTYMEFYPSYDFSARNYPGDFLELIKDDKEMAMEEFHAKWGFVAGSIFAGACIEYLITRHLGYSRERVATQLDLGKLSKSLGNEIGG